MGKRKSNALIDSEDSRSSDSDSGSDTDKDMLSLSKKKGPSGGKVPDKKVEAFSSSESDSEWHGGGSESKKGKKRKPAKRARRSASGTTHSSASNDDSDKQGLMSDNSGDDRSSPSRSRAIPPTSSSVVSSSVNDNIKTKTASDLEEGEVSDDDWDQEEFFDGYDENMMGDAEDQRKLSAMTEKEREQEIFTRIEKRDLLKNRFEAEKKLRMKKKIEAKLAKRGMGKKFDEAMLGEDDPLQMDAKVRSQERKKTVEGKVDKKSQAMDALKSARDAKIQRQQEKAKIRQDRDKKRDDGDDDDLDLKKDSDAASTIAAEKRAKKLKASDVYSDDSGSEYEDDKRSKEKEKSRSESDSSSSDSEDEERNKKPQYLENVEDLNRIRLSRFKLERWLYLPFFLRVIKGCYVRVGVAVAPGQRSAYKVYEIDGLDTQQKPYEIGATKTNKVLLLKLPGEEKGRKYRFEFVSNQACTEAEFQHWKQRMEQHQVGFPTINDIENKEKEIKEAMEYQLEEEDIEAIINEKAKFKSGPVNFAARKAQLMKEREQASQGGEDEKASELSLQIAVLDERATVLDKVRTSTISSISYINQRNRQRNVEEAEKAILEELKINKGKKVEDPFTRRTTKPRIVSKPTALRNGFNGFETFIKTENGGSEPLGDTKVANLTIDEPDSLMKSIVDELDIDGKDAQVGDLFSAHDFDIKLDLDAKLPPNLPIVARPSITTIKDNAPRRSLNLEEYKRKKGLI